MNGGSSSGHLLGDDILDAAQTLANLNSAAPPPLPSVAPATHPSFKPPIGVPSGSGKRGRGSSSRGGGGGGSGRGRGRGGRPKSGSQVVEAPPSGESEEPDEGGGDEGSHPGNVSLSSAAKTINIGDKAYPEAFFDEILNIRKLELLQDPEILALLQSLQRK